MELTGEAMELIGDFYAELRSNADSRALPVTVRACPQGSSQGTTCHQVRTRHPR